MPEIDPNIILDNLRKIERSLPPYPSAEPARSSLAHLISDIEKAERQNNISPPVNPHGLEVFTLGEIVQTIQEILWLDPDSDSWDPEKEWSSDTIEAVAEALIDYGLRPDA